MFPTKVTHPQSKLKMQTQHLVSKTVELELDQPKNLWLYYLHTNKQIEEE